jgi:PAS domain S-box-containing protein
MIRFQRMSIHNKLALALGGAAFMAFAVAGAALALFGSLTLEGRARQVMEPYAQLVSVGAEAAVAFEDPGRAREILATLRANPQILEAEIVLRDGRLLARYASTKATFHPHPPRADGIYLVQNRAELIQSLQDGAHLHLVMGLDELNRQTRNFMLLFAAGVLVLLVAVTMGLRLALQRTIVRPISTLAETVEQVRTLADYHRRVPASGDDEVARLGKSFNAMMGAIQEREDDLRRLTLFQRTILDNAAYGIISAAPDGVITSFNRAAERLLGYTADEVVGKQTPACWHDPEEIARRALRLSEELGETILPGFDVFAARPRRNLPEESEWTFIRKDGARLPVLLSVTALRDESGRITGFVGLTYDLTERKQAEEALRTGEAFLNTLLNAIPIPVFYKDRDGRYLGFNRAYETFFGATKDQLIGKTVFDINPSELAESYRAKDTELLESGGVQQYESQVENTRGVLRDIIFNKAVFTDSQGTIIGLIGAILDITEHKAAEQERLAHLNFLASMDRINRAIQGTNDLERMMSDVLDVVLSIFDCNRAYLMYPCDPEAESWVIPMERTTPDYPGSMALGVDLSKDAEVAGKLRLLLSSDGPVNMGPGTPYMLTGTTAERFNIRSMMAMAIYPKVGKSWEFGIHQCSYPRVWTPDEKTLLQEIGRRLSDGMTSLLAYRNLQESEENLCTLNEELEQRVRERTAELETKNAELYRMNRIFVGRELRMVELKDRIRELEENTGTKG